MAVTHGPKFRAMFARTIRASIIMPLVDCVCSFWGCHITSLWGSIGGGKGISNANPQTARNRPDRAVGRVLPSNVVLYRSDRRSRCYFSREPVCVCRREGGLYGRSNHCHTSGWHPWPPKPSTSHAPFPVQSGQRCSRASSCRPIAEMTYHVASALKRRAGQEPAPLPDARNSSAMKQQPARPPPFSKHVRWPSSPLR